MEKKLNNESQPEIEMLASRSALIAEFMGCQKSDYMDSIYVMNYMEHKPHYTASLMRFDKSWDWLMPVVDKIMRTKIGDGVEYVAYPYFRTFGMLNEETKNPMVRFHGFQVFEAETLIEATFLAVVDFLDWWQKK